jgi:hypothetical protein
MTRPLVLPAAALAVLLAGCSDSERRPRFPTAPTAAAPPPTTPAPTPVPTPPPSGGPPEDQPIPGSGPTHRVGTIPVASGQTVDSRTEPTDPACWPNWDASGRCKAFEITAPSDGTLTVAARLASPAGGDNLDLFLIDPGRAYVVSWSGVNAEEASLPVTAGSSYGIAVMTYTTPTPFQLQVEVVRP